MFRQETLPVGTGHYKYGILYLILPLFLRKMKKPGDDIHAEQVMPAAAESAKMRTPYA